MRREMKKYAFEEFMSGNGLKKEQLPELLQKRIIGFEELKEDLHYTVDDDKQRLEKKLEDLAEELEEDLYEVYEDELENNSLPDLVLDEEEREEKERLKRAEILRQNGRLKERLLKRAKKDAERREAELKEAERKMLEKKEAQRMEAERKILEKKEAQRMEAERKEMERIEAEKKQAAPKTPELSPDESLIERLYKSGQKRIGRSGLLQKGFKTNLEGRKISVGKYKLVKALFSYSYSIELA